MVNLRHIWLKPALLAATLPVLAMTVSACATTPMGQDKAVITGLIQDREAMSVRQADDGLSAMMAKPMTLDGAVQMAIIKSPKLALIYGQLGIDQADILEAIEIGNPRLGLSSLSAGGGKTTAQSLTLPIADLILMPARLKLAQQA
ncbi:MAG: hypothetical protein ORN25_08865, partial [Caulobacteraceae bacterium]|nr:hypothetical protein [Caulobacteraceae bacterium]